jgi:DNA (cytosine-5)-methyltransferase 1
MRVLDLFSGIGGFSLGLERAGMRTVAMCEINPFCRRVLRYHWPHVPIYGDIRELSVERAGGLGGVDVICGGFPCQDISTARHAEAPGLAGERSGLWSEMFRLVCEYRPDWVLIENVARLRTLGADRVLGDLEDADYTGRPFVVRAEHVGAPHPRPRVWIVANANRIKLRQQPGRCGWPSWAEALFPAQDDAHADRDREPALRLDAEVAGSSGVQGSGFEIWERQAGSIQSHALADGLPDDLDAAIAALGNAVVPHITHLLGRAIVRATGS